MTQQPIYRDVIAPNDARIRQQLIKEIQDALAGDLLSYTANPGYLFSLVMHQDVLLLEDLLSTSPQ